MKPLLSDVHLRRDLHVQRDGFHQRGRLAQHPPHKQLPRKRRGGGRVEPMGSDGSVHSVKNCTPILSESFLALAYKAG